MFLTKHIAAIYVLYQCCHFFFKFDPKQLTDFTDLYIGKVSIFDSYFETIKSIFWWNECHI